MAWWTGASAPAFPPKPDNGIAWYYGAGAIQYFYAQDPNADVRTYKPENHAARVQEISALMDSTNPDLSTFHARAGKLIVLEDLAICAERPGSFGGTRYVTYPELGSRTKPLDSACKCSQPRACRSGAEGTVLLTRRSERDRIRPESSEPFAPRDDTYVVRKRAGVYGHADRRGNGAPSVLQL